MPVPSASEPAGPWGPDGRRAAVAISFAGLAGLVPEHPVTPALPTLLRVLGDRGLAATFFVEAEIAAAEPFALSMIDLGRHELAVLAEPSGAVAPALDALARERFTATGALLPDGLPGAAPGGATDAAAAATTTAAAELTAAGIRYVAAAAPRLAAAPAPAVADGLVRLPITVDDRDEPDPGTFHLALQAEVGGTLARGGLLVLALRPSRFERQDALNVLVESLDLVAGLVRAERLWVPRLDELAATLAA